MARGRVLITGLSGFTGRYVKKELERRGYEVYGLDYLPARSKVDLRDFESICFIMKLLKPDYIIHLAGISSVVHKDSLSFYETNVIGTENLLKATRICNPSIRLLILASSANVYGAPVTTQPICETSILRPVTHYGISKLAMELVAKTYSKDLPITIVRPFNYTGVDQSEKFVIPKIIEAFKKNVSVLRLGNLDVARDFSDVRDVAMIYGELLDRVVVDQLLNICSSNCIYLSSIINYCRRIFDNYSLHIEVDDSLVRSNEIEVLYGSNEKLKNLLNINFQYSIEETLLWMAGFGN